MDSKKPKYLDDDQALQKLMRYCAYQERCHNDARTKLIELGIYGDRLEKIIAALIEENYINETRFATTYARGKFNFNHWGKVKITNQLKMKNISAYNIKKAMLEIEDKDYFEKTDKLLTDKMKSLDSKQNWKSLLYLHMLNKGYEQAIIRDRLEIILNYN
jgi:regulatory protein